ncbi:hypothetical protein SCLAR_v1c13140 [Spiroplasma clarkii]|uniref:Uncharacterized protein n=1 Tax=Spiroplasma clarkii TaxID=2139 RepID=A0A2K8KJQ4_9MOLU|nr:hypothetical protein SCLAR_v1c13140 [Spiroplasma clarkii]
MNLKLNFIDVTFILEYSMDKNREQTVERNPIMKDTAK